MRELFEEVETGRAGSDPMESVRRDARAELPRRFYKDVTVAVTEGGHGVLLDGRPVRSPAGTVFGLPTHARAELVAAEFSCQGDRIDPATMPAWRLVNTALDGVAANRQAVIDDIVRFAGSDLLCYRADTPKELVSRQTVHWDPILAWARADLGGRFNLAEGVMHVDQPPETIAAVGSYVARDTAPIRLAALHLMTSITGSALIALATEAGHLSLKGAWLAAHVDEDWNIEQWGADADATARREARWRDFAAASRLVRDSWPDQDSE